jgi:hypothetical protein
MALAWRFDAASNLALVISTMNFFPAGQSMVQHWRTPQIALSHAANEPLRSFALFEAFAARHAGLERAPNL